MEYSCYLELPCKHEFVTGGTFKEISVFNRFDVNHIHFLCEPMRSDISRIRPSFNNSDLEFFVKDPKDGGFNRTVTLRDSWTKG